MTTLATYDMLRSPHFLVADPDATAARLVGRVGLPGPYPSWAPFVLLLEGELAIA